MLDLTWQRHQFLDEIIFACVFSIHNKISLSPQEQIYSEGLTGKSNLLKVNQDKTHSVLSQRSAEKLFLGALKRNHRIIWPPSSSANEWTNLDHSVTNELHQLPFDLSI